MKNPFLIAAACLSLTAFSHAEGSNSANAAAQTTITSASGRDAYVVAIGGISILTGWQLLRRRRRI